MTITRKYTLQQQQYRESLFPGKWKRKIVQFKPEPEPIEEKPEDNEDIQPVQPLLCDRETFYMRNCIFWIDEYEKGACTKEKFDSAIRSLKLHINKIELKYQ